MALSSDRHKMLILIDLLKTENDYVQSLETLIELVIEPMRKQRIVPEDDLGSLFGNIEALIPVHKSFMEKLTARVDFSSETVAAESILGDIFSDFVDSLQTDCDYSSLHLEKVFLQTEELPKRLSLCKAFLDKAFQGTRYHGLNISCFTNRPIGRLCMYPLLFRELLKYIPPMHPDHQVLSAAIAKLQARVEILNEQVRLIRNKNDREILH